MNANMKLGTNAGNGTHLVPHKADTLLSLQTRTYLRAWLGDSAKLKSVGNDLDALYERIISTTKNAQRLAADISRTPAQRHIAAKSLADGLVKELRSKSELFAAKANQLIEDGHAQVESVLSPRAEMGYVHSEIRGWIREQVKTPAGMQVVADAYKSNLQIASTIYSSPHMLMNLSESLHKSMVASAVELHAPKGAALMNEGEMLEQRVARGFGQVMADISSSFYSAELVAEAEASRVQV